MSGQVQELGVPNTVVLRKPFTLQELLQTVALSLGKARTGEGVTE